MQIRISATRIKSWFQYRCERKFIYSGISSKDNNYKKIKRKSEDEKQSSWGQAGNAFEDNLILNQLHPTPENSLYRENPNAEKEEGGFFAELDEETTRDFFCNPHTNYKYTFQATLPIVDDFWIRILGLTRKQQQNYVHSLVKPDILERKITKSKNGKSCITVKIIDVKATGKAMLFHRAQVAFYALLIEGLILNWTRRRLYDVKNVEIKIDAMGSIWHMDDSPDAVQTGAYVASDFRLKAYHHMVKQFCLNELVAMPKKKVVFEDSTQFHLYYKCEQCEFLPECLSSIQHKDVSKRDISAIVGMSKQAKNILLQNGMVNIGTLAKQLPHFDLNKLGSSVLVGKRDQFVSQAQTLMSNEIRRIPQRKTMQMPHKIDCKIYLLADRNPITNTLSTLACGIVHESSPMEIHSEIISHRQQEQTAILAVLSKIYHTLSQIHVANTTKGAQKVVHIFTYEPSEAEDIKLALTRSLEGLLQSSSQKGNILIQFAKMFPPDNFTPEAEYKGVRHLPGCAVQSVLKQIYSIPVQVAYDLSRISQKVKQLGNASIKEYKPEGMFSAPFSSRLPIEVCNALVVNPTSELKDRIQQDIEHRLLATDSIVQWIIEQNTIIQRQDPDEAFLSLYKAPFEFLGDPDEFTDPNIAILATQTVLESRIALLQTLIGLAEPEEIRVANLRCINQMTYIDHRKERRNFIVRFRCPPDAVHTDISSDDINLLLTDGRQQILLHPEKWPSDPNLGWRSRQYYVAMHSLEEEPHQTIISLSMSAAQWSKTGPIGRIHERVQQGKAHWVLDQGYRDWTLYRLENFFRAMDE